MAETLGAIDTGYAPIRPTDDLIQASAGTREAQRMNLINQTGTQAMGSLMSAANVSSQIAVRERQADSEIAYKNNLIDMNISRENRALAKLPYELRGLEASNWINETVAVGNELKNHLAEATMAHRIEQEALDTEVKYASLQDLRMRNEAARKQVRTEEENRPKFNDYWDRVARGEIDPEETPRPDYGGNKALTTEHDTQLKTWRGSQKELADRLREESDIKAESKQLERMSGVQRKAVEDAKNPDIRRDIIFQAKRTNDAIDAIKAVDMGRGTEIVMNMAKGIDPATGLVTTQTYFDSSGNLTNAGIETIARAQTALKNTMAQQKVNADVAKMNYEYMLRAQRDATVQGYANAKDRVNYIRTVTDKIVEANAEKRELDETIPEVTRQQASQMAADEYDTYIVPTRSTSGGPPVGGPSDPTDAYARVVPSDKYKAQMAAAVLARLGKFTRDAAKKELSETTVKDGFLGLFGDKKSLEANSRSAGMAEGWSKTAADAGSFGKGFDIDIEDNDVDDPSGPPDPMIQESIGPSPDSYDSIAEAFFKERKKLSDLGVSDMDIISSVVQPHPAHIKAMGLKLPYYRGLKWAYYDNAPQGTPRWQQFNASTANTAAQRKAEDQATAASIFGIKGAPPELYVQDVDFTRSGESLIKP